MWYPIILQRSLEEELMKRKGLLANEEDLEEIKVVRREFLEDVKAVRQEVKRKRGR